MSSVPALLSQWSIKYLLNRINPSTLLSPFLYLCPDYHCPRVYRTIASSKDHTFWFYLPVDTSRAYESNTYLQQPYNYGT